MARAAAPNSANSQFFLMRYDKSKELELEYTVFGRVISGLDVVRRIKVGEPVPEPQDRMLKVRLLADIPAAERPSVQAMDTAGAAFKALVDEEKARKGGAFTV